MDLAETLQTNSKKLQQKKDYTFLCNPLQITGALGIEPSSGVLETLILPMNYAPMN